MPASVRNCVRPSQRNRAQRGNGVRLSVVPVRQNVPMARKTMIERDPGEESRLRSASPGERVRYWRMVRGLSVRELADQVSKKTKCAASTLGSLERGATAKGKLLPEIAAILRVSYDYIKTGKGEPEQSGAITPVVDLGQEWPLPGIPRHRLEGLDEVELGFLQSELVMLLDKIESRRRKRHT